MERISAAPCISGGGIKWGTKDASGTRTLLGTQDVFYQTLPARTQSSLLPLMSSQKLLPQANTAYCPDLLFDCTVLCKYITNNVGEVVDGAQSIKRDKSHVFLDYHVEKVHGACKETSYLIDMLLQKVQLCQSGATTMADEIKQHRVATDLLLEKLQYANKDCDAKQRHIAFYRARDAKTGATEEQEKTVSEKECQQLIAKAVFKEESRIRALFLQEQQDLEKRQMLTPKVEKHVEQHLQNLQDDHDALIGKYDLLQEEMSNKVTAFDDLQQKYDSLSASQGEENALGQMQDNYANMEVQLHSMQAEFKSAQSQLGRLQGEFDSMQQQRDTAKAERDAAEAERGTAGERLARAQHDANLLRERAEASEARLREVESAYRARADKEGAEEGRQAQVRAQCPAQEGAAEQAGGAKALSAHHVGVQTDWLLSRRGTRTPNESSSRPPSRPASRQTFLPSIVKECFGDGSVGLSAFPPAPLREDPAAVGGPPVASSGSSESSKTAEKRPLATIVAALGASAIGAEFPGASAVGAELPGASAIGAELPRAIAIGAELPWPIAIGAALPGAIAIGAEFPEAIAIVSELTGATDIGSALPGAIAALGRVPTASDNGPGASAIADVAVAREVAAGEVQRAACAADQLETQAAQGGGPEATKQLGEPDADGQPVQRRDSSDRPTSPVASSARDEPVGAQRLRLPHVQPAYADKGATHQQRSGSVCHHTQTTPRKISTPDIRLRLPTDPRPDAPQLEASGRPHSLSTGRERGRNRSGSPFAYPRQGDSRPPPPRALSRSPTRRARSHERRQRSPKLGSRSPKWRHLSPKHGQHSPQRGSCSPRAGSSVTWRTVSQPNAAETAYLTLPAARRELSPERDRSNSPMHSPHGAVNRRDPRVASFLRATKDLILSKSVRPRQVRWLLEMYCGMRPERECAMLESLISLAEELPGDRMEERLTALLDALESSWFMHAQRDEPYPIPHMGEFPPFHTNGNLQGQRQRQQKMTRVWSNLERGTLPSPSVSVANLLPLPELTVGGLPQLSVGSIPSTATVTKPCMRDTLPSGTWRFRPKKIPGTFGAEKSRHEKSERKVKQSPHVKQSPYMKPSPQLKQNQGKQGPQVRQTDPRATNPLPSLRTQMLQTL